MPAVITVFRHLRRPLSVTIASMVSPARSKSNTFAKRNRPPILSKTFVSSLTYPSGLKICPWPLRTARHLMSGPQIGSSSRTSSSVNISGIIPPDALIAQA